MTGAVTHFEIYAEEPATLAEFYRQLFDWRLERAPGMDYWRIETGAGPAQGFAGGLTYRPIAGTRSWMHYVHVASLNDAVVEASVSGRPYCGRGRPSRKPAWYAVLADPEGNIFGDLSGGPCGIRAAGAGLGGGKDDEHDCDSGVTPTRSSPSTTTLERQPSRQ